MSEPVTALAPFVERALTDADAVEALGGSSSDRVRPGSDGTRTVWGAAFHAGQRVE